MSRRTSVGQFHSGRGPYVAWKPPARTAVGNQSFSAYLEWQDRREAVWRGDGLIDQTYTRLRSFKLNYRLENGRQHATRIEQTRRG